MPIIRMNKGEMLNFYGPIKIEVLNGLIEIVGRKLGKGEQVIIHRLRNYVVYAIEESELSITMDINAQIKRVDEKEPYPVYSETVKKIIDTKPDTIAILGGIDCGKSTLTVMLSNIAIENKLKPAVIDGDVGQADIGPPGFVSMAYPEEYSMWMREYKPVAMKFIGDIKPQGRIGNIIKAIKELVSKAREDGRKPIIIDTDGWINDEQAILYKRVLIEELQPSAVIVLGTEYHGLFKDYEKIGTKVYELPSPSDRRIRTRDERRLLRSAKYREFLENANTIKLKLDNVIITGLPVLQGVKQALPANIPLEVAEKVLWISRFKDTLYIVAKHGFRNEYIELLKNTYGVTRIKVFFEGFEKRYYGAVSNGVDEYPAILEEISWNNGEVVLRTIYGKEIKIVRLANYKLNEEFLEQYITNTHK
ncbi:MAG: Clp1/GlmU family protein [Thermoprotei archaeon]